MSKKTAEGASWPSNLTVGESTVLSEILDYASSIDLPRFVLPAPFGAEFVRNRGTSGYTASGAAVVNYLDAKRRPRIAVPIRPCGHIICTDLERLEGVMWCYDLLRAGYGTAHIHSLEGTSRRNIAQLLVQHLFERTGKPGRAFDFGPLLVRRPRTYDVVDRRVLMVTDSLGRGGSERQMVILIARLIERGFDVRVLSLNRLAPGAPNYEADLQKLGINVRYAGGEDRPAAVAIPSADLPDKMPLWLADRVRPIVRAIRSEQPALVHGWLDAAGIAAGVAGCMLGVPRTLIQQGSMAVARRGRSSAGSMQRAYRALAENPSIAIVNNCAAGARDNEKWIGLPRGAIGVIYNGFDPSASRAVPRDEAEGFRRSLELDENVRTVGTVMRFVPEKDPDLWVDTAAAIAAVRQGVRFLIFGFGPLEARIRERVMQLGLERSVIMGGPISDAGLAYSVMDVVLLTSSIEGLPNVVIEAQAAGRPVVGPDVGGMREALEEHATGTIVTERSADALARAVLSWFDDDARRARVETLGPKFVASRFGLNQMVETTLRHYGESESARDGWHVAS